MILIPKPVAGEYAPYALLYLDRIQEGVDILSHLRSSREAMRHLITSIPENIQQLPFAPGEWTVKEILQHVIDQERVFVYRALRFARQDITDLPTFDHDEYAKNSRANQRSMESLLEEYDSVRQSTLSFFGSLVEEDLTRVGSVGGNPVSVRALAWFTAGHEAHHMASIQDHYVHS